MPTAKYTIYNVSMHHPMDWRFSGDGQRRNLFNSSSNRSTSRFEQSALMKNLHGSIIEDEGKCGHGFTMVDKLEKIDLGDRSTIKQEKSFNQRLAR
jgi:hypothetical protein